MMHWREPSRSPCSGALAGRNRVARHRPALCAIPMTYALSGALAPGVPCAHLCQVRLSRGRTHVGVSWLVFAGGWQEGQGKMADNLTHGLAAALLAQTGFQQRYGS